MTPAWQLEISELHRFFEGWLGGTLAKTETAFGRLTGVLAPAFNLIGPSGEVTARDALAGQLFKAHGSRGTWRIWIKNPTLRFEAGGLVLATYEEWQEDAVTTTSRLSTVLFQRSEAAPNGLSWLHVHETWLNEPTAQPRRREVDNVHDDDDGDDG